MTLSTTTETADTTSIMPVPVTTPTSEITVLVVSKFYDILFSFHVSGNVDTQTKYSIRNETALYLNTNIEMVGLLQTENYSNSESRLLSIDASFTVSSVSYNASKQIESRLTVETLNEVLRRATNGTITASNLIVSMKYAEKADTKQNTLARDLIGSLAGVLGFGILVIVIYVIVQKMKHRKTIEKSSKTDSTSFDVSSPQYCIL